MVSLGNIISSIISVGLREVVDGMGKNEFEKWIVEERLVGRSRCRRRLLLTFITKLTRRLKFKIPRIVTYRILCEGLEAVEGIMDAIECFHQMTNELTEETIAHDKQAGWVVGEQSCIQCSWRLRPFSFRL